MANPFPGMNPYLEDPAFWPGIHDGLIFTINEALNAALPDGFVARTGERVYIVEPGRGLYPDVLVREANTRPIAPSGGTATLTAPTAPAIDPPLVFSLQTWQSRSTFVEIIVPRLQSRVITVIEILSYSNKTATGPDRQAYLAKQNQLFHSDVHFIEIDLLRGGEPTLAPSPAFLFELAGGPYDYAVCLHRAGAGEQFEAWTRTVREPLPRFAVPLTDDLPDVPVDLQTLLNRCYQSGAHDALIDYQTEPNPPLRRVDAEWANDLLRQKDLR